MHDPPAPRIGGLLAVTGAGVLWGTTGVVVQFVNRSTGLDAVSIGFWRLAVAAAAMALISLPRLSRLLRNLRGHPGSMILAGVGLATYQASYFLAVVWVGVAVATLVSLGVAPVMITIWESVRTRRRPAAARLTAVGLALLGLLLIQDGGGGAGGSHPGWGLLAALVSGTLYAATAVLSSRLAARVSWSALTTVMCTAGAVTLLPLALAAPDPPRAVTGSAVIGLIYMGIACTAVAYGLFNAGLRTVPSGVASILTLWEPLTATALAVLLLGEALTPLAWLGSALLLGSVALSYVRGSTTHA